MGWTDTQDKELLLVTISKLSLTVSGEVWEKVAQELGRGLTGSAVKQHYNAICKKATPGGASKTAKSSASSTPKSTRKKASIAGAASAKGSKKRGVAEVQNDDEDTVESQEGAAWSNANEAKKTKVELSDDEDGEEYAF